MSVPLFELRVSWKVEATIEMPGATREEAVTAAYEAAEEGRLPLEEAEIIDNSFRVDDVARVR